MTNINAAICRIYRKNFRRHYPKNKKLFLPFLFHFWNANEISGIFKKNQYPSLIISEIIDSEIRGY